MTSQQKQFTKKVEETHNLDEIKTLCFDLGLIYDELPGDRLSLKVLSLIIASYKADHFESFYPLLLQTHPHEKWPSLKEIRSYDWESIASKTNFPNSIQKWINQIGNNNQIIQGNKNFVMGENAQYFGRDGYIAGGDINFYVIPPEEVAAVGIDLNKKQAGWDGRIPYLGLRSFRNDEKDALFYFGRETLVKRLFERVEEENFIGVVGPSGSGKSSVVRAGLIYGLQSGRFASQQRWKVISLRPGVTPLKQLGMAVVRDTGVFDLGQRLIEQMGKEGGISLLAETLEAILPDGENERCLLFIDQFEELFVQTKDESEREWFIEQLVAAAKGRIVIVAAMRIDFLSDVTRYPALRKLFNDQIELVGEMSTADLRKAITLPALAVGVDIEPGLVKEVIEEMHGEPGALAMMSFALRDLFDATKLHTGDKFILSREAYLERGGVLYSLEHHAKSIFDTHLKEDEELVTHLFSRLVEIGERGVITRRQAHFEELVPHKADAAKVTSIIEILSRDGVRLLAVRNAEEDNRVSGDDIDGKRDQVVEISHEKLIDAWPWLKELIATDRDLIRLRNRVRHDAEMWQQEEEIGYLWSGGRLTQIEETPSRFNIGLDPLSLDFIEASFKRRETERREKEASHQRELTQERARLTAARRAQRWQLVVIFILFGLIMIPVGEWGRQQLLKRQAKTLLTVGVTIDKQFYWGFWGRESNLVSIVVAGFAVEMHEVTNWQYSRCVLGGECEEPVNPITYQTITLGDHPVVNVTAYQADSYCQWLGRRLPKSEEWENVSNSHLKINRDETESPVSTSPVIKSYSPSFQGSDFVYGLDDNVREWTTSPENPLSFTQIETTVEWVIEGSEEKIEQDLIVRGGSFKGDFENGKTSYVQSTFRENVGFRCYMDLK